MRSQDLGIGYILKTTSSHIVGDFLGFQSWAAKGCLVVSFISSQYMRKGLLQFLTSIECGKDKAYQRGSCGVHYYNDPLSLRIWCSMETTDLLSDLEKLARGCMTVFAYKADRSLDHSGHFRISWCGRPSYYDL